MKKGIVLYRSKYGATEKYAHWLAEAANFACADVNRTKIDQLSQYDIVIFGGGIYASGISGLSFLRKHYDVLKNKTLAVFCVGASPYDEKTFAQICSHNLKDDLKDIPCFYCRGGWNEEAMSWKDRTLCQLLQKMVAKKDPSAYEPWETALMAGAGKVCDWTDSKYLEPILDFVAGQER